VLATGTVDDLATNATSLVGGFLAGRERVVVRDPTDPATLFDHGRIQLATRPVHTVHALDVEIPKGRLTAVTGMSGSGKTTLVLDSLVPALQATTTGTAMPEHVVTLRAPGIERVNAVDATPIGTNVRSTVATYSGILDDLRRAYAATTTARERGLKASAFSYNTGVRHSRTRK
jgi:excinuclease ABC subunit A